jgi:hypothetical protein
MQWPQRVRGAGKHEPQATEGQKKKMASPSSIRPETPLTLMGRTALTFFATRP